MPYTIKMACTVEKTDEEGNCDSFVDLSRYYDDQELSALPKITDHFSRLIVLAVENDNLAQEGSKLGVDSDDNQL